MTLLNDSSGAPRKATEDPTKRLAQWAVDLPRNRTAVVYPQATEAFKDLLICMVGGSTEPSARRVADLARSRGNGQSTIIGCPYGGKTSSEWAAFANGSAAHILDFDDSFAPLQGHVSVTIIPAIIALGEERDATGADLLDALAVGVEVAAVIGSANKTSYNAGWHNTAIIGVIATAVACSRLIRLSARQTVSAIGIATSNASGNMKQNGYDVKALQPAFAARDGVLAALLAESGTTGAPETLMGPMSFSRLYSGRSETEERYILPADTDRLAIDEPGIIYKPYACCGDMHRAIDGCLRLVHEHNLHPSHIECVDILLPFNSARNLPYKRPVNTGQARFSVPYNVALAFVYRRIRLSDYDDAQLQRPELVEFLSKVTLAVIPDSEGSKDTTYLDFPNKVKVTTKTGEVYETEGWIRKGDKKNPLTVDDWENKIDDCLQKALSPKQAKRALLAIDDMRNVASVRELIAVLHIA